METKTRFKLSLLAAGMIFLIYLAASHWDYQEAVYYSMPDTTKLRIIKTLEDSMITVSQKNIYLEYERQRKSGLFPR